MSGYWMQFPGEDITATPESSIRPDRLTSSGRQFYVRYGTPTLGFSVSKTVSEDVQRMLQIAVEAGKAEARAEIRKSFGL